jgi:uncharacterized beta-barrel protein YwiB (DUF1934 family)
MKTLKLIPVILFALLLVISQAHAQKKNEIDTKLDRYEKVTKRFCSLMEKQNDGENVYQEIDEATREFAELNQELSELIEDGKLTKKQYNRFIKITEKYEECSS